MAANKKYFTSKEAAEYLARSERTLLNMRNAGMLIEGTCWIRKIPQNPNSHVLYNLDACDEVLNGLARASSMEQPFEKKMAHVLLTRTMAVAPDAWALLFLFKRLKRTFLVMSF